MKKCDFEKLKGVVNTSTYDIIDDIIHPHEELVNELKNL